MMTVEEIRAYKEKTGYTIAQLSEQSGVPIGTLQKILSGETKKPRQSALDALEDVLRKADRTGMGKSAYYLERSTGRVREISSYGSCAQDTTRDIAEIKADLKQQGFSRWKGRPYTIEDYMLLPDDMRVELIEGTFYDMASPSVVHQMLLGEIYKNLSSQIEARNGKCITLLAPMDTQLMNDEYTIVQPDIMIVCDRSKITTERVIGAPDFVLEILSRTNRKKDLGRKLSLYLEAGISEYWIVDPLTEKLLVYHLAAENGMFPEIVPFEGKRELFLYQGEIAVDLDALRGIIEEFGKN